MAVAAALIVTYLVCYYSTYWRELDGSVASYFAENRTYSLYVAVILMCLSMNA